MMLSKGTREKDEMTNKKDCFTGRIRDEVINYLDSKFNEVYDKRSDVREWIMRTPYDSLFFNVCDTLKGIEGWSSKTKGQWFYLKICTSNADIEELAKVNYEGHERN